MNKENSFNNSLLLSNSFNNIFHINNSNTNINNENDTLLTDYDTFLNNNSHNEQNIEDDNPLNISLDTGKDKEKEKENYIKFNKLPNPKNKAEIKIFVNNLLCYINIMLSCSSMKSNTKFNDELFIFKYKLETRYNDYRNHGLNEQYFINILNQNQEELINKMGAGIKNDKKEDSLNSININNIVNIHSNYSFIGKKRKKSLSEIRSITDGSSSYEEGNSPL